MSGSERNTSEFVFSDPKNPNISIEVFDLETLETVGIFEVPRGNNVNGKPAKKPAPSESSP